MSVGVRAVPGGKVREDLPCGCGYLYEPTPQKDAEPKWTKYQVVCCNSATHRHERLYGGSVVKEPPAA